MNVLRVDATQTIGKSTNVFVSNAVFQQRIVPEAVPRVPEYCRTTGQRFVLPKKKNVFFPPSFVVIPHRHSVRLLPRRSAETRRTRFRVMRHTVRPVSEVWPVK